ncbi:hypothetical protein SAMN05414139_08349 [Burkholderia sp. D7]|nr:hypothetical protein SAMN05414139_08349 [Burkholderia sp. D7]
MPQRGLGTLTRQDILLPPGSQTSGATALFIYSGEVSFNFTSGDGTTISDQLQILIDPNVTDPNQIVGSLTTNPPIPLVFPTSWNSNGGKTVIAINSPTVNWSGGSGANPPSGGPGLYIFANVSVQNGSLLNAQYQVSVRMSL